MQYVLAAVLVSVTSAATLNFAAPAGWGKCLRGTGFLHPPPKKEK